MQEVIEYSLFTVHKGTKHCLTWQNHHLEIHLPLISFTNRCSPTRPNTCYAIPATTLPLCFDFWRIYLKTLFSEAKEGKPVNLVHLLERGRNLLNLLQQWTDAALQLQTAAIAVDEGHRIYINGLQITYQNFRYWLESMLTIEVKFLSSTIQNLSTTLLILSFLKF